MNFDFDFDAPFGVLSDVMQKFDSHSSCTLEQALIDLIQFDIIDLTEHSQWQDLVDILDNIISNKINGDGKIFELICVVVVRFLQGLDSMYQKEDSLRLACQIYQASLQFSSSMSMEMKISRSSYNGNTPGILMKVYFRELTTMCLYSQSDQIESLFSFSISLLQYEFYQHGFSILDSSDTLFSFIEAIESFRKTSVAIIMDEANFFLFSLKYVSSKIQTGAFSPKSWKGLLILLLSISSIVPHHCEVYSKTSLLHIKSECPNEQIPTKSSKRKHVLNKMFSTQNSLLDPSQYISTLSSGPIVVESPVWLNEILITRLKFGSDVELISGYAVKILTIILDIFGPTSCGIFLKTILEDSLSHHTLSESHTDLLCEMFSFINQRLSINEIQLNSVLFDVISSLVQWKFVSNVTNVSFRGLIDIADFVLNFCSIYSENDMQEQATCLVNCLQRLSIIFQTESISEQNICKLLCISCRMLKFAFRWLPLGEQRNNIVQECAQIFLLLTERTSGEDSPIWYLAVDLVIMADILGCFPFFSTPVKRLFDKASRSVDILGSCRDDSAFSRKENFIWSMRQLAAGLILVGNLQDKDVITNCITNNFPDLLEIDQQFSINSSFRISPYNASQCINARSRLRSLLDIKLEGVRQGSKGMSRDIIVTEGLLQYCRSLISLSLESVQFHKILIYPALELISQILSEHDNNVINSSIKVDSLISSFNFEENTFFIVADHVKELFSIYGLKQHCAIIEELSLVPLEVIIFGLLQSRFLPLFSLNECIAFAFLGRFEGWMMMHTLVVASIIKILSSRLEKMNIKGYESVLNTAFCEKFCFEELLDTMKMFLDDSSSVVFLRTVDK